MAICLECGCPNAAVSVTRTVRDGERHAQVRLVECPNCGLMAQSIIGTGPALKRDYPHNPTPKPEPGKRG